MPTLTAEGQPKFVVPGTAAFRQVSQQPTSRAITSNDPCKVHAMHVSLGTKLLLRSIRDSCTREFSSRGYAKSKHGLFHIEVTKDFFGWIGLNEGVHSDRININPFVGIHCMPIEKMLAKCKGRRYRVGEIATFADHFGYVAPEAPGYQFRFFRNEPVEPLAKQLVEVVDDFARPAVVSQANYGSLISLLKEREARGGGVPEALAVAYYMTEGVESAQLYLDRIIEAFQEKGKEQIASRIVDFRGSFYLEMQKLNT